MWKTMNQFLVMMAVLVIGTGCVRFKTPEQRADFIAGRISSKLELNQEQNLKLQDLKNEIVTVVKSRRATREAKFDFAVSQIRSESLDLKAIEDAIQERRTALDDVRPQILEKLAAFHGSLSPEQKEELVAMLTQLKARFE